MKNATNIEFTKQWCKKEMPATLKKSGPPFEKAIDELVKTRSALKPNDEGTAKALQKAVDQLSKAAKDVIAEAKALEKKTKDKAEKTDLQNTAQVMLKPFEKALAEVVQELENAGAVEEIEESDEEDEASDDKLADPAKHADYIKKTSTKLKKKIFNFALGFSGNKPEDMRFNFHNKKAGRSLGGKLKAVAKSKKFTFGKVGTQALEEGTTGEEGGSGSRTLILYIEGRRIPGLAKRVKLMFRTLKVAAFSKVKIVVDGKEVESADDDMDLTVQPMDLDAPDDEGVEENNETVAPPPPPTPTSTDDGGRAEALRRRLADVNAQLAAMTRDDATKFQDLASKAQSAIDKNQLDAAEKIIAALEQRVGSAPEKTSEDRAEQIRKALTPLVKRVKELEDKEVAQTLGGEAQAILGMLRAGQLGDAAKALAALAEALKKAEAGGTVEETAEEEESRDPMVVWRSAKEVTDVDLSALQSAISDIPDPNLQRIAEYGLNGITQEGSKGRQVAMQTALMNYNMAGGGEAKDKAAKALREMVADYRSFIESDALIKLCEKNPFDVKVDIRGPMNKALTRIEALVAG
ncbi:MAG: hypothetical protein AAF183_05535 [Pseudomonadota bacterium]